MEKQLNQETDKVNRSVEEVIGVLGGDHAEHDLESDGLEELDIEDVEFAPADTGLIRPDQTMTFEAIGCSSSSPEQTGAIDVADVEPGSAGFAGDEGGAESEIVMSADEEAPGTAEATIQPVVSSSNDALIQAQAEQILQEAQEAQAAQANSAQTGQGESVVAAGQGAQAQAVVATVATQHGSTTAQTKAVQSPSEELDRFDAPTERKRDGRPIIVFDHVSKVYPAQPNRPALANITLEVYPGEFIFLVGHSGSGKSTFIRLLNRELVATNGRITVAGENLNRLRRWLVPYLRRSIGCVFQDYKLLPNKTAYQNVAFALEVIGKSRHIIRTQVPEVLRLVGLEDKLHMLPDQLSGGEQQRVCIARAIVNRPSLLICDEPTGNLDPQTSLGIMRLLDRINRTGTTVIVATHDREMVDSMRKRVVELENGYLVRDQDRGVYGLDG
jgi:cell division transport system ATP-binding protein